MNNVSTKVNTESNTKSTHEYTNNLIRQCYLMMSTFMLVMSMVRPHQCMNPATSVQVSRTHIITNMEPLQLPRVIRVVTNIQARAMPMFLINSIPTIASVSQLM